MTDCGQRRFLTNASGHRQCASVALFHPPITPHDFIQSTVSAEGWFREMSVRWLIQRFCSPPPNRIWPETNTDPHGFHRTYPPWVRVLNCCRETPIRSAPGVLLWENKEMPIRFFFHSLVMVLAVSAVEPTTLVLLSLSVAVSDVSRPAVLRDKLAIFYLASCIWPHEEWWMPRTL